MSAAILTSLFPLALLVGVLSLIGWRVSKFGWGELSLGNFRPVLGALLLVGGAVAAIFGTVRINSTRAQLEAALGQTDSTSIILIVIGASAAVVGLVILVSRNRAGSPKP